MCWDPKGTDGFMLKHCLPTSTHTHTHSYMHARTRETWMAAPSETRPLRIQLRSLNSGPMHGTAPVTPEWGACGTLSWVPHTCPSCRAQPGRPVSSMAVSEHRVILSPLGPFSLLFILADGIALRRRPASDKAPGSTESRAEPLSSSCRWTCCPTRQAWS